MIYLQFDINGYEEIRHFKPFDEVYGLGKTESELQATGVLVEQIPELEVDPSKVAYLKYDGTNLYYEYKDAPIVISEQANKDLDELKSQNAQMLFALVQGGLM